MDAKAELDALEQEAKQLTEQLQEAEARWTERVQTQGADAVGESDGLHEIRNRLQIIQARSFRLKKDADATVPRD